MFSEAIDNRKLFSQESSIKYVQQGPKYASVVSRYSFQLRFCYQGTQDNYGIAELGSTSLQLAFAAKEDPDAKESFQYIQINGKNVSVYGHSYLCFGRKEMERRIMAKLVEVRTFAGNDLLLQS